MEQVLTTLLERAWALYRRAERTDCLVCPSVPILFFGDRKRYSRSPLKVITVGLNPSRLEFPDDDPFQRFPRATGACGKGGLDLRRHLEALQEYFRTRPYTAWFNPSYEPLLNGADCSYYDAKLNTALHTDLCSPLATDPTWSGLSREQKKALQTEGVELWRDVVECLEPDLILVSVAQKHLTHIQFPRIGSWRTIYTVRRENPYEVKAVRVRLSSAKESLVVFGQAAQLPFGTVSKVQKEEIGAFIKESCFDA